MEKLNKIYEDNSEELLKINFDNNNEVFLKNVVNFIKKVGFKVKSSKNIDDNNFSVIIDGKELIIHHNEDYCTFQGDAQGFDYMFYYDKPKKKREIFPKIKEIIDSIGSDSSKEKTDDTWVNKLTHKAGAVATPTPKSFLDTKKRRDKSGADRENRIRKGLPDSVEDEKGYTHAAALRRLTQGVKKKP